MNLLKQIAFFVFYCIALGTVTACALVVILHAVFGFSMALALLSKFTTLGFFPVGAGFAFAFYLAAERPGMDELQRA